VEANRRPSLRLVEAALLVPDGWVYEIDGEFDADETVPRQAIRGAWTVGPDGVITGDFIENPNYLPSWRSSLIAY
jgi:hypothetical protein